MANGEIGVAGGRPFRVKSDHASEVEEALWGIALPCLPSAANWGASQITLATRSATRHKSKAAGGTAKVHEKDHTTQTPRAKIRPCGCAKRFFGSGSWFVTCYCHGRVGRRIGRVVRYSRRPAG